MNRIYLGQLYLIDSDERRAETFKGKLRDIDKTIFFNHFHSINEAFKMALEDDIIAPELIYVHVSLADFAAREVLKKLRRIHKTMRAKVIVYGGHIPEAVEIASGKYNFDIIRTFPQNETRYCQLFNTCLTGNETRMICSQQCKCC